MSLSLGCADHRPIPDLSIPRLPPRALTLASDGTATAGEAGPSTTRRMGAPELDRAKYERTLSKREKKAVSWVVAAMSGDMTRQMIDSSNRRRRQSLNSGPLSPRHARTTFLRCGGTTRLSTSPTLSTQNASSRARPNRARCQRSLL